MRLRLCTAALGVFLLTIGLVGCGGGSTDVSTSTKTFTGKYAGPFAGTINGAADSGTLTTTVASDGSVTGASHSNVTNTAAVVTGTLSSAGAFVSTFVYPSVTYTVRGTVAKSSSGHLIGTLTEVSGVVVVGTITIDLSPD